VNIRSRSQLVGGGFFIVPSPVIIVIALLIALTLELRPARADEGSSENQEENNEAEVVEIRAARIPEVSRNQSALVTEIKREDMGPGLVTTAAMAQAAVAVRLREHGGLGQPATVGVRGSAAHQTLVALDGVVLPDPLGSGVDLSFLPAEFLDRIEILRGGASAQYGSGALGGVINLVSRKVGGQGYWGRLSAGSFGTWTGHVGTTFEADSMGFLLMASGLTTAGDYRFVDDRQTPYNPYDDRDVTRENNFARQAGLLIKARRRFSNGAMLRLTQKFMLMARGVPGLMGFTASQAKESGWTELLDLRASILAGSLLLEGGANLFIAGRELQDPLGELTGTKLDQSQELRVLETHLKALVPFGASHMVSSRLNWRWTGLDDDGFANPERQCLAIDASAQFKLAAETLEINPWLRLEHTSDAGWQLAPGLGLAYEIQAGLLVKSNLARAYRVPNFNELYMRGGFQVGNPDLVPEQGWTLDAGLEWRPSKSYRVSLAGFYARYSQLIVFEPISNFRYKPLNTDGADIGGIEFEASLRPLRWLNLAAHYTFLLPIDRSGKPNRDGNDLPGRPRHTAGLRLNGKWNRWLARAAVSFVGANFINQANTKQLTYRFLLNLGLGVDAGSGMTVMLEARNLLNNQIQDVRGLPLPGISFFLTIGITKGGES